MKKIISLLLILATVLSCFMLTVSADEQIVSDEGRLPFEDVRSNHWFYSAVSLCYANSVIKGMDEYTFDFSGQLTRAQFVTMLAGLEGIDTSTYSVEKFTDIKDTYWYYGAVAWAYGEGIVSGMTENTFDGNGRLTRAQLAVIMSNYMQNKYDVAADDDALDKFTDKPKAEYWYYDAMKYAVSAGLILGMSDGTLCATGIVTRAQAAVIFDSFMKSYFYGICEHSFTDTDCITAETCEKCGFVNGIPNGHVLTAYDCVTGGKCTVCGTDVEPSSMLHDFTTATCTAPRTCIRCSAVRGKANGHKWITADCFTAKHCKVCNITEGSALGHSTDIGRCTRCGYEYYPSPYAKAAYFMRTKHKYNREIDGYINLTYGENTELWIWYYEYSDSFKIEYITENGEDDFERVTLYLTSDDRRCIYTYEYVVDRKLVFEGSGAVDPSEFTSDTVANLSSYKGGSKSDYIDGFNLLFRETLVETGKVLDKLYEGSIRDLGFKMF